MAAILSAGYVIEDQINVIGDFADIVGFATTIALYIAAAWALWLATLFVIEWIIASPAIPDEGLDANLLRLLGRVVWRHMADSNWVSQSLAFWLDLALVV